MERDLYSATTRIIQPRETLDAILRAHGVAARTIAELADKARPVLDLRKIRAGHPLRIYRDTTHEAAHVFIYKPEPERYVVFDLRDSVAVYDGLLPVNVVRRSAQGVITSSPYATLQKIGADPALAILLARVFAWQVDFYRMQRGDRFTVVYDERVVEGTTVGIDIIAARFDHAGQEFYAIGFNQGEAQGYYDELGNTLRRPFLRAPLEYSRISSRFTRRRYHPVQKRYAPHLGTDYVANVGTPIVATADGSVSSASYTSGNGRFVKIRHSDVYTTGYLHMSRIAAGIKVGSRVRQGDVIGYVGSTGLASGPHVCYRFWMHGRQVDPITLDMPPAEALVDSHHAAFGEIRDALLPHLKLPAPLSSPSNALPDVRRERTP